MVRDIEEFPKSFILKMLFNFGPFVLLGSGAAAASVAKPVPKGFVTTNGGVFKLDGKDFYFAGSNAYYLPFTDVSGIESNICNMLTITSWLRTSRPVSVRQRRPG